MASRPVLLDLSKAHTRALEFLIGIIPPDTFIWALTGSAGLRLQGVDIQIHDLDIHSNEKTIYILEQHLTQFMKTPVHYWESGGMRSLDGKVEIENIAIEILANIAHKKPDGTWTSYTDFSHLNWLDYHGLQIPTFPLEDELEVYESMGRTDKATLIRKTIVTISNK